MGEPTRKVRRSDNDMQSLFPVAVSRGRASQKGQSERSDATDELHLGCFSHNCGLFLIKQLVPKPACQRGALYQMVDQCSVMAAV